MVNVIPLLKLKVCPSILIFIIQRPDYKITDYCHYPVYLNIDWLLSYPSLFFKRSVSKPTLPQLTCSFAFNWLDFFPNRRVKLSCLPPDTKSAVKRNCWVLLGYLLLHLWFYGWRDALRKWVWKCFVSGQRIMRLGSQK